MQTQQPIGEFCRKSTPEIILDGHKLFWHRERVEAWLKGERIAPITIDSSLTRRCSYKCIYCYGTLQENEGYNLDKDTIFRFLDDAAEIGVKAISFVSDGESAHSPHVYDAIIRGKNNGLDMAIGTNGFPLKDERLYEILPALTYIRFLLEVQKDIPKYMVLARKLKVINTIKKSVEKEATFAAMPCPL